MGRTGVWGGREYGAEGSMGRKGRWGGRESGAEGSMGRKAHPDTPASTLTLKLLFCLCDAMGRRCFGLPQKVRARTYITYGLLWVALSLVGHDRLQAHAHIAPSSTSTSHAMPEVESVLNSARGRLASYRRSDGCSDSALHASLRRSLHRPHTIITHLGGGVMTSFLLESPDKHYHQTKPAIPDNDKAVTPFRRTNSFSLALVHTFRRHERGRAGACATRAGRKLIAQGGDQHMPARPQPGFNFILFTSHVPFLALPDGRVPAAAHTNSIQGWFPAGLPVRHSMACRRGASFHR